MASHKYRVLAAAAFASLATFAGNAKAACVQTIQTNGIETGLDLNGNIGATVRHGTVAADILDQATQPSCAIVSGDGVLLAQTDKNGSIEFDRHGVAQKVVINRRRREFEQSIAP